MNIIKFLILLLGLQNYLFSQNLDTTVVNINNITLPLINDGVIGVVEWAGMFDSSTFLYSSGFFMSGKSDDSIWSSAVFVSDYYRDYLPGEYGEDPNNEKNIFYVIKSEDEPFGTEWQNWKNAVDIGAYFYDGNNNGFYDPIDLNENGIWDENEDRPDLLGDYTAFTVFNDGKPANERFFRDVEPQGIEIKQSVFAYHRDEANILNNVIFFRYILENVGQNITLDSVYFGVAADHDIGWYGSDLTGCDTLLNCTYGYKRNVDIEYEYGENPPSFLVSLLQGPTVQNLNSDAIIMKGPYLGKEAIKNSKLLEMTSSFSYKRPSTLYYPETKEEMLNYLIGGMWADGTPIDVKNFTFGNGDSLEVADTINPKYMFSGDPVLGTGWLNIVETDWRFLISTGPFKLEKGKPQELIYAYIVGRGDNPLNSVTVAKEYAKEVRRFYESNFTEFPVNVEQNKIEQSPNSFYLFQNYPNPFNPNTVIKYQIPNPLNPPFAKGGNTRGVFISLKVYDILGREVAILVNERKPPGNYKAVFDARELSSGVYFYKLQSGDFVQTKKMILLR